MVNKKRTNAWVMAFYSQFSWYWRKKEQAFASGARFSPVGADVAGAPSREKGNLVTALSPPPPREQAEAAACGRMVNFY